MGSIGQYAGVMDYISNAYIRNVTLLNGQNGARLKAWAGSSVGYGYIDNVTYEDVLILNTVSISLQSLSPAICLTRGTTKLRELC